MPPKKEKVERETFDVDEFKKNNQPMSKTKAVGNDTIKSKTPGSNTGFFESIGKALGL